jgi:general secretion pathway protein G
MSIHLERHSRRAGFTLAEMMVVIVILGLLATLVVPNVLGNLARAQRAKATADISAISSALDQYAINNAGKYPESLDALVAPDVYGHSFLNRSTVPLDPWKNPYGYEPPVPGRPRPRVFSMGKDGQPGGDGDNQDIDSEWVRDGGVDHR